MKEHPQGDSRRMIHQTGDRLEAALLRGALESEGVPVFVSGNENPLAGLLDMVRWVFWVDAADEARAREIMASLAASVPDEDALAAEALFPRPPDDKPKD